MTNALTFAIWVGSLAASGLLGAFMLVQALTDRPRRWRYAVFSALFWLIALFDFLQPNMDFMTYELLRLLPMSAYGAVVLWLMAFPTRWVAVAAVSIPFVGITLWYLDPAVATTITFPLGFLVATFAHDLRYSRHQGYSSAILRAYSIAMAMTCSIYYPVLSTHNIDLILLGYVHWMVIYVAVVLFGWVHLPRELRGQAPVRVTRSLATGLFIAVVVSELGVILGILEFASGSPTLYFASTIIQLAATLTIYFYHSHQLVIHTDNVEVLLADRTASLRRTQEELSRLTETQAQKLQEQTRELKAKSEVIDRQRRLELAAQTAGQAAHDIQTLISPILVYVSQLQREEGLSEATHRMVSRIRNQIEHLMELNGQLLALSRRGRLDLQPVEISEMIEELPERFPGRRLVVETSGEIWMRGSWSQLSRALTNLVTNGLDASHHPDDPVTVRCGVVELSQTQRCHLGFLGVGQYAKIEVEDRGQGIPEAIQDKIFEPFFSTKTSHTRSGSGLGLSIVAAVVDDHRGVLDLRTGPKGTCFILYFPAIAAPAPMPESPEVSSKVTVIVTDDDTPVRQRTARILGKAGYTVLTAEDGVETIKILQNNDVDLILLDLKMPRLSGLETFIAALHLRPGIRVIVHSSYVADDEARRLRALGVDTILQKPAGPQELLSAIRRATEGQPSNS